MRRVIITGGIGSGKSVVSHMLLVMGYPVYDCDSRAIDLIDTDSSLKAAIVELLGKQAYDKNGHYDRQWVAQQVFTDRSLLDKINNLVVCHT